jgi:hypothetical protein
MLWKPLENVHLEDREVYFKKVDGTGLRRSGGV